MGESQNWGFKNLLKWPNILPSKTTDMVIQGCRSRSFIQISGSGLIPAPGSAPTPKVLFLLKNNYDNSYFLSFSYILNSVTF